MEKHILRWSYLLGLACVATALLWRAASVAGLASDQALLPGSYVGYMTLYKGALLFLVLAIATGTYSSAMKMKE